MFVAKGPEEVMREQLIISSICSVLMLVLFFKVILLALPVALATFYWSWRLPKIYLTSFVRPARINKFSTQMVDALTLMANGMKSGLNVPQTIQIVVDEMPSPINEEFGLVLKENQIGLPLEKAFDNLGKRIPSEDVSMFVTSINILRETGGNLAETFDTITKTIRERMKLAAKISAMTAQGMTSAIIVSALPWGLGAALYILDPDTMRPLFTHPIGWVILFAIFMLEAVGFFVILKIVKIRV